MLSKLLTVLAMLACCTSTLSAQITTTSNQILLTEGGYNVLLAPPTTGTPGTYTWTLPIPPASVTSGFVEAGTASLTSLQWDNTNSYWKAVASGGGSSFTPTYAYTYNVGFQFVPIGFPINFNNNGAMSAGISHALGTSDIIVSSAGTYEINFTTTAAEPRQVSLFVNGVERAETRFGSDLGTSEITGHCILVLAANDVLTLRNAPSSNQAFVLVNAAGGFAQVVNASMLLRRLE